MDSKKPFHKVVFMAKYLGANPEVADCSRPEAVFQKFMLCDNPQKKQRKVRMYTQTITSNICTHIRFPSYYVSRRVYATVFVPGTAMNRVIAQISSKRNDKINTRIRNTSNACTLADSCAAASLDIILYTSYRYFARFLHRCVRKYTY